MSTSSPLNYPTGSDGASVESIPVLPTFRSSGRAPTNHHEKPDSTPASSRNSWVDQPASGNAKLRDSRSYRSSLNSTPENSAKNDHARHRRNRSSGGFLLDPVSHPARFSRDSQPMSRSDPKGKRRSNEVELSVSKRRIRNNPGVTTATTGSSPLAAEIKQDIEAYDQPDHTGVAARNEVRHSTPLKRQHNQNEGDQDQDQTQGGAAHNPMSPKVGYDTDPTQIVNMALTLSEVRRRQASGKRYTSGELSGRRAVSAKPAQYGGKMLFDNRPQSAVSHQLASHNGIYKPGTPIMDDETNSQQQRQLDVENLDRNEEDDSVNLEDTYVSSGTRARVAKAKTYFELAYEHRRLLSHLPPIRRPTSSSKQPDNDEEGKIYNPLQYVRNRKLRIWDKTRIDTEAEGWHDVEKVRTWVDAVISSSPGVRRDPDECVRLPPLSESQNNYEDSDQEMAELNMNALRRSRTAEPGHAKPRLPRSDWITYPANLIADAFWLEQGVNKIKIQDRNNNQIYPSDTHFKFSGWRNRVALNVPPSLQEPTPPPEPLQNEPPSDAPALVRELPSFKPAYERRHSGNRVRTKGAVKDSTALANENRSRRRALRLFKDDSDSDTSDSSDRIGTDTPDRGRRLISRKRQRIPPKSDETAAKSLFMSPKFGSDTAQVQSPDEMSLPSSTTNSKRSSVDHTRLGPFFKKEVIKAASPLRSDTKGTLSREQSTKHSIPVEADHPRTSAEYDSTAPNSPVATVWPSIAINLSPPQSRSASPVKKPFSSIVKPFKDRPRPKETDSLERTDFRDGLSKALPSDNNGDGEKHTDSSTTVSRAASPMTRGVSPFSKSQSESTPHDPQPSDTEHRDSTISRVSTKSAIATGTDHSRIRGIFKGGRIAEIVGNEVSRVGDFILKRDAPTGHRRRISTSDGSLHSFRDSDTDEGTQQNGNIYKTPPPRANRASHSSTVSSTKSEYTSPTYSHSSPVSGERPRYHNPNLPSFTSPFQRDREQQENKQGFLDPHDPQEQTQDHDHISLLAAQHRNASRSPRLDRLAPPKINTSGPGTPTGLTHVQTYGFGSALDLSRSRDASDKLNTALGNGHGIKGSRSAVELSNSYRFNEKQSPQTQNEQPIVMQREITRAQALILTTTIKAREIQRRSETPRIRTPKFLLDSLTPENKRSYNSKALRVNRREEHVVAAQNLMAMLTSHTSSLNEKLDYFNQKSAPNLHADLQTMEDTIDNNFTPRVRATADAAGELSMKLATTSTLAIKGLHDTIESALRQRRRGPIRWVRRLWFASIEWTVVGLLWAIWAVVTLIRVSLNTVQGVIKIGKWLLWLS